jgi:hypothetical protein
VRDAVTTAERHRRLGAALLAWGCRRWRYEAEEVKTEGEGSVCNCIWAVGDGSFLGERALSCMRPKSRMGVLFASGLLETV